MSTTVLIIIQLVQGKTEHLRHRDEKVNEIDNMVFFSQAQKATGNPRSLFQKDTYVTIGIAYILN